jgi:hypothetical protein
LDGLAGRDHSAEAELALEVQVGDGRLILVARPDRRIALTAAGADRFTAGGNAIVFTRDGSGQVTGFLWSVARARNVAFLRR